MRASHTMTVLFSIALPLAAVGCGGFDGAADAARASGLDSPDFAIDPTAETLYTVGELEGEPWETFGSVSNVAFDGDGNLYILDRDAGHVVVIGPEGEHLRTISNQGEGPGELAGAFGMVVLADRVAVFDFSKQGFQVFSLEGEFLEAVTFNPQDGMPGGRIYGLPDESIISAGGMRIRMGPDGPMEQPLGRPIDRFRLDGTQEVLYTAFKAEPPEEESSNELAAGNQRIELSMPVMRAFEPQLHVGVLRDGRVAVVDSVGYKVKLIDDAGAVASALERGVTPIGVTPDIEETERARQLAALEEGGSGGGGRVMMVTRSGGSGGGNMSFGSDAIADMMRDRVEDMIFAAEIPAIRRMSVDWSDRIWVERSAVPGEDGPTDILTAEGQYLGTVDATGLRIPAAFGPDGLMAYIESDELEVQRVRVARVQDDEALEGGGAR